jgi:hypothetical protein
MEGAYKGMEKVLTPPQVLKAASFQDPNDRKTLSEVSRIYGTIRFYGQTMEQNILFSKYSAWAMISCRAGVDVDSPHCWGTVLAQTKILPPF